MTAQICVQIFVVSGVVPPLTHPTHLVTLGQSPPPEQHRHI